LKFQSGLYGQVIIASMCFMLYLTATGSSFLPGMDDLPFLGMLILTG